MPEARGQGPGCPQNCPSPHPGSEPPARGSVSRGTPKGGEAPFPGGPSSLCGRGRDPSPGSGDPWQDQRGGGRAGFSKGGAQFILTRRHFGGGAFTRSGSAAALKDPGCRWVSKKAPAWGPILGSQATRPKPGPGWGDFLVLWQEPEGVGSCAGLGAPCPTPRPGGPIYDATAAAPYPALLVVPAPSPTF